MRGGWGREDGARRIEGAKKQGGAGGERERKRGTSCILLLLTHPPACLSTTLPCFRFETVFQGLGELLEVERATLFLLDPESQMLWSQIAKDETGKQLEIKVPLGSGVVGHVAKTGQVRKHVAQWRMACDVWRVAWGMRC